MTNIRVTVTAGSTRAGSAPRTRARTYENYRPIDSAAAESSGTDGGLTGPNIFGGRESPLYYGTYIFSTHDGLLALVGLGVFDKYWVTLEGSSKLIICNV